MSLFINPSSGDTWSFSFEQANLNFTFTFKGKIYKNIYAYDIGYDGINMPCIVTQYNHNQINAYFWQASHWQLKKLNFKEKINNFCVSKTASEKCHIIVETYSGNCKEILHYFCDDNNIWHKKILPFSSSKIVDLTFIIEKNILLLTAFCKKNRLLLAYKWDTKNQIWKNAGYSYYMPKGTILALGYTRDLVHLVSIVKDKYYKLIYTKLDILTNTFTQSSILMLPAFYPNKCYLIQENNLTAILVANLNNGCLFYSMDGSKWIEASVCKLSSIHKIFKVAHSTGYISSSLAFYELFNIRLQSPVLLKASNIIELLKK